MSKYLDSRFLQLEPYTPGEQLRSRKLIKLNTNESPFPPSPLVREAVQREIDALNLYPDITGGALPAGLARRFGVEAENVFLGNGSDEILAFIFQALCKNGVAFADISYGFYPVYAKLYGVSAEVIPLREDFRLAVEDYAGVGKTIVVANPNAPTGLALARREVEELLASNRENLVVIDEAYVDFGAESSVPLLEKYENLLVAGTFSKSRSLAGGRLGYALASRELIAGLERIRYSFNPYNINQMTLAAATAALCDEDYFRSCRDKIIETREKSIKQLTELGFLCTNSKANFIFTRHKTQPAKALYGKLKAQDILVRWFDLPRIRDYLRITVGANGEMDALLLALEKIVNAEGAKPDENG